jgi:hypothetical protein
MHVYIQLRLVLGNKSSWTSPTLNFHLRSSIVESPPPPNIYAKLTHLWYLHASHKYNRTYCFFSKSVWCMPNLHKNISFLYAFMDGPNKNQIRNIKLFVAMLQQCCVLQGNELILIRRTINKLSLSLMNAKPFWKVLMWNCEKIRSAHFAFINGNLYWTIFVISF